MKLPDEPYDLDAEIAKYGGRVSLQRTPVGHQIEVATRATADPTTPSPYDLDAEIAKYGGQSSPRPAPLAALDQVDPSLRSEVEAFAGILGASVDLVVPRGVPDPRLAGGMSRPRWERRRLDRLFREGRVTMEQARDRDEKEKAERATWLEQQRQVQHGWAKWMRWRSTARADAEEYRREHEDGRIDWFLELAAQRTRLGGRAARRK
jgi:hypothetical protein